MLVVSEWGDYIREIIFPSIKHPFDKISKDSDRLISLLGFEDGDFK